ncbi:MAG TPA: hypothetical protein VMI10_13815 [Terriglobales bacterium]|nr:hypothetical protein [Terriglobales bacterium]
MRYVFCSAVAVALIIGIASAQNQSPPTQIPAANAGNAQTPMAMNFTPGTLLRVKLDKTIDAKKAQVGDQIVAKTLDDLKSVPPGLATKGCEIVGHVVEVTQHQGDSPSKLRIVFDKMVLKNGNPMPLPAFIKAVGFVAEFNPATNSEQINAMGGGPGGAGADTVMGGQPSAGSGNPAMYAGGRLPMGSGSNPDAKLPYNAIGAIGMSGVTLGQGTEKDSILTSNKKNVKLEGGMQMILKTN